MFALLAELSPAQNQSPVALDTSETLFAVLTAINTCGYDQELASSDPLRSRVRSEVAKAREATQEAKDATQAMCTFYEEHQQPEASRTLAQYTSARPLPTRRPHIAAKVKDADMPPDAMAVIGHPSTGPEILPQRPVYTTSGKEIARPTPR